jgi:hypothetical protein
MQGSGVTVVKEAGQFFPFGVPALHGRFEQRFLNIPRHVTPNIHGRSSQQVCVAFLSVGHWASDMQLSRSGTAGGPRSSIAITAVEHYEICRYGTLIAWAEELGHDEIVRILTTNLNEEKAANTKLNTMALRKGVNSKASTAA